MSQSAVNPTSSRRLVSFLEAFKSELPSLEDSSSVSSYDSGIDRGGTRQSVNSYEGRVSVESYRPVCHSRQITPSLPGTAVTCITQFSRALADNEFLMEENHTQVQTSSRQGHGVVDIPERGVADIGAPGSFVSEM